MIPARPHEADVPPAGHSAAAPPPFVSVLMPVRDEAAFIRELLDAVLRQDYPPDRFEVIVADGMSTDGTREILAELQARDARLVVIDNPERFVSTGLNAALAVSRGDVVIRIDGHSLVAPDFIRENIALLAEHPEAWSVGGPIRHSARTTLGKAVAVAMSHPLGVGNALHRYAGYSGYCEGTAFPAIRRWVFDRVGTFDVRLVRNQDDEFNYRITHAGGKAYISPRVQYSYFVRERLAQLFYQYFQYGFWRIPVIEKHRRPTTLRQMVPTLFYVLCVLFAIIGASIGSLIVAAGLPGLYVVALAGAGADAVRRHGMRVGLKVPLAIATLHTAYGFGMAYGLWARFFRRDAWSTTSQMAAISR